MAKTLSNKNHTKHSTFNTSNLTDKHDFERQNEKNRKDRNKAFYSNNKREEDFNANHFKAEKFGNNN